MILSSFSNVRYSGIKEQKNGFSLQHRNNRPNHITTTLTFHLQFVSLHEFVFGPHLCANTTHLNKMYTDMDISEQLIKCQREGWRWVFLIPNGWCEHVKESLTSSVRCYPIGSAERQDSVVFDTKVCVHYIETPCIYRVVVISAVLWQSTLMAGSTANPTRESRWWAESVHTNVANQSVTGRWVSGLSWIITPSEQINGRSRIW